MKFIFTERYVIINAAPTRYLSPPNRTVHNTTSTSGKAFYDLTKRYAQYNCYVWNGVFTIWRSTTEYLQLVRLVQHLCDLTKRYTHRSWYVSVD